MKKETFLIKVGKYSITATMRVFEEDEEMDIEDLLRIDISNLAMEIITFPVVLNRLGVMLAEAEDAMKAAELDMEIYIARKREEVRNYLKDSGEKMTQDDMKVRQEQMLKTDPNFRVKTVMMNKLIKNKSIINSLFWTAKDKSGKLDVLANTIKNQSLEEILEQGFQRGEMNGVVFKSGNKLFE